MLEADGCLTGCARRCLASDLVDGDDARSRRGVLEVSSAGAVGRVGCERPRELAGLIDLPRDTASPYSYAADGDVADVAPRGGISASTLDCAISLRLAGVCDGIDLTARDGYGCGQEGRAYKPLGPHRFSLKSA